MKQYFLYECKKKLPAFAAFTIISLLICSIFRYNFISITAAQTACLGVMAVLLPAYLFSDFYSKKGVDFYYSLPITREKLVIVKILAGLVFLFASYTIFFWGSAWKIYAAALDPHNTTHYSPGLYPLWLYLTNLALSVPLFGYSTFAFTRANNLLDGFVHLVAYTLLVCILLEFVSVWLEAERQYFLNTNYFISFETLDRNTVFWQGKIGLTGTNLTEYMLESYQVKTIISPQMIAAIVTQAVLGLSGLAGTIFFVRFQKAEDLGGVSKSLFSYRVLIPLYLFISLFITNHFYFQLITIIPLSAAGYLGYCLYARSFVIGKKNAIVFVATVVVALGAAYIMQKIYPPTYLLPDYW